MLPQHPGGTNLGEPIPGTVELHPNDKSRHPQSWHHEFAAFLETTSQTIRYSHSGSDQAVKLNSSPKTEKANRTRSTLDLIVGLRSHQHPAR